MRGRSAINEGGGREGRRGRVRSGGGGNGNGSGAFAIRGNVERGREGGREGAAAAAASAETLVPGVAAPLRLLLLLLQSTQ